MSDETHDEKSVNEQPKTLAEPTPEPGVPQTRFQPPTLPTAPLSASAEPVALSEADRAEAAKKYAHSPAKLERDEVIATYAPLRAVIVHAANGDRTALAAALTALADLHQGPLAADTAADHLRTAGAALAMDRRDDAAVGLNAARGLLQPGEALDSVTLAQAALAAADDQRALQRIDEALSKADVSDPAPEAETV